MFKKSLVFSLVSLVACACISCSDDDDKDDNKGGGVATAESCAKVGKDFNGKTCVEKASKDCTSKSTSQCNDACEGNKKYYWDTASSSLKYKNCYQCKMDGNKEVCGTFPDCVAGGTEYCTKACKADGSEGYYYSQGKVETKTCAANDCTIVGERVACESEKCDPTTYPKVCDEGGKSYKFCNKDGLIQPFTCDGDKVCSVTGSGESTYISCRQDCTATSTAKCDAACSADEKAGYYWNGTQSKLETRSCNEGQKCQLVGTSVNCISSELAYQDCTGSKCGEDGNIYFCDVETHKYYSSNSSICGVNKCGICKDGFGGCGYGEGGNQSCATDGHDKECTGDNKLTTGGAKDNCCDPDNYKHTCSQDKNTLYRCRSWGKVELMTCKGDCAVDADNEYTCTKPN